MAEAGGCTEATTVYSFLCACFGFAAVGYDRVYWGKVHAFIVAYFGITAIGVYWGFRVHSFFGAVSGFTAVVAYCICWDFRVRFSVAYFGFIAFGSCDCWGFKVYSFLGAPYSFTAFVGYRVYRDFKVCSILVAYIGFTSWSTPPSLPTSASPPSGATTSAGTSWSTSHSLPTSASPPPAASAPTGTSSGGAVLPFRPGLTFYSFIVAYNGFAASAVSNGGSWSAPSLLPSAAAPPSVKNASTGTFGGGSPSEGYSDGTCEEIDWGMECRHGIIEEIVTGIGKQEEFIIYLAMALEQIHLVTGWDYEQMKQEVLVCCGDSFEGCLPKE